MFLVFKFLIFADKSSKVEVSTKPGFFESSEELELDLRPSTPLAYRLPKTVMLWFSGDQSFLEALFSHFSGKVFRNPCGIYTKVEQKRIKSLHILTIKIN
ncbi:hypothetical protein Hanom_Chr06g00551391 [Helianthus anomalus]